MPASLLRLFPPFAAFRCTRAAIRRFGLLALLAILPIASAQPAAPAKKAPAQKTTLAPELVASLESHAGLTYARYGGRELQLDLFRPRTRAGLLPAVICIHGGGWSRGDRTGMRPLAQALAARGFVAVTISYRLSGEAKFPAAIHDAKAAVRWLRANAATYGIDPDAIGVTGHSAGGHLAALLATSGGVAELEGNGGNATFSSRVQACVAGGAQTDFETSRIAGLSSRPDDPHYTPFLGGPQSALPQLYALASPRHHLDRNDPPLAFVTGELDDASTRADDIRRDLMRHGIATGLTVVPKAPHAFLGQQAFFDTALNAIAQFFALHLTHRSRPAGGTTRDAASVSESR